MDIYRIGCGARSIEVEAPDMFRARIIGAYELKSRNPFALRIRIVQFDGELAHSSNEVKHGRPSATI